MKTDRACQFFEQKDSPLTHKHFRSEPKVLKFPCIYLRLGYVATPHPHLKCIYVISKILVSAFENARS